MNVSIETVSGTSGNGGLHDGGVKGIFPSKLMVLRNERMGERQCYRYLLNFPRSSKRTSDWARDVKAQLQEAIDRLAVRCNAGRSADQEGERKGTAQYLLDYRSDVRSFR